MVTWARVWPGRRGRGPTLDVLQRQHKQIPSWIECGEGSDIFLRVFVLSN